MDDSSMMRNPWSDSDRSLGSIRNVLSLAERTGHLRRDKYESQEEVLSRCKCSSLRMISKLRQIEKDKVAIDKATLDIQCRLQDKETSDLTHLRNQEKRIENINKLNSNLQNVVTRKDELIHRLQQPYVGDYIKIDASHKMYMSKAIPLLVPILSELSSQLDTIEWASKVTVFNTEMDCLLTEISALLASLQSSFRSMLQMRHSVSQLRDHRVPQFTTSRDDRLSVE